MLCLESRSKVPVITRLQLTSSLTLSDCVFLMMEAKGSSSSRKSTPPIFPEPQIHLPSQPCMCTVTCFMSLFVCVCIWSHFSPNYCFDHSGDNIPIDAMHSTTKFIMFVCVYLVEGAGRVLVCIHLRKYCYIHPHTVFSSE